MVTYGDSVFFQFRCKGSGRSLATVAGAIDLLHEVGWLATARLDDFVGDQLRFQQLALGEIKGIEIAARVDGHLDIGKQARQGALLAKLVHRSPIAAAKS